ncbi:hypothetical protein F2Q69_00002637 [Brassica cretica]|uniref:Uncharacterized protein n=1 Tax=Brassica cretica TaxID=69181 RepID=A0A8S9NXC7_BRACR|nr:hypothetical protein F2Q69_00002637 [Brassica cretica]
MTMGNGGLPTNTSDSTSFMYGIDQTELNFIIQVVTTHPDEAVGSSTGTIAALSNPIKSLSRSGTGAGTAGAGAGCLPAGPVAGGEAALSTGLPDEYPASFSKVLVLYFLNCRFQAGHKSLWRFVVQKNIMPYL